MCYFNAILLYKVYNCVAPAGWMPSCSITWVATRNAHVSGGERVKSANSLSDCQTACLNRTNCSGLNWNSGSREGWRCWLHGPWSGRRTVIKIYGITHFDIKYNCDGENMNFKICLDFVTMSLNTINCGLDGKILFRIYSLAALPIF